MVILHDDNLQLKCTSFDDALKSGFLTGTERKTNIFKEMKTGIEMKYYISTELEQNKFKSLAYNFLHPLQTNLKLIGEL